MADAVDHLRRLGCHLVACGWNKVAFEPGWQLRPWGGWPPAAHVGMVPGRTGWAVLDVDTGKGRTSQLAMDLVTTFGRPAICIDTPSGGRHLWYRVSGRKAIGNMATTFGDVRVDRGYVVLWDPEAVLDAMLFTDTPAIPRARLYTRILGAYTAKRGVPATTLPGRVRKRRTAAPAASQGHVQGAIDVRCGPVVELSAVVAGIDGLAAGAGLHNAGAFTGGIMSLVGSGHAYADCRDALVQALLRAEARGVAGNPRRGDWAEREVSGMWSWAERHLAR